MAGLPLKFPLGKISLLKESEVIVEHRNKIKRFFGPTAKLMDCNKKQEKKLEISSTAFSIKNLGIVHTLKVYTLKS